MGVYGNIHGAFNGLGKPSIKLEFEDNESLVAFSKKMQDEEPAPVQWNEEEEMFTPVEGYGDKYIVTDLRQRAKKEPGEVKSLTKFQFSKFKNAPELFEPVASVSPSLFSVYPVYRGINNGIVYFGKEFSDDYNADFILKDYVVNKSEGLVTLNFARYKAYGTDGVSIVSVWSFSISCPVCNIITAYGSKIDAYFGLIEFAEGLIAVLKNAQSKLRSNSKDYKTLQFQIERWQDAANQYADSLGAPGDTYIITDTRTRARKDLEDTAALKKYDIRKFSGEELQKMQTDDPLLYEQIKSDLEGYGDFYTVRDMRKRSRKEPGDVAANKNLQFTKDSSRTIQNFDKDLYLAQQANPYSFDKEVNGKKYINCDVNVSGRWQDDTRVESYHVNVWFFSPHKKNGKNTFKGYNTYVPVDVELSDFVNLERRKSSEFYGYVPESKYKEWFNEALKKQIAAYQRTIRSGNSYAAENAKDLKYLVEYYSNIDKYTAYVMHNYGDPTLLNPAIVEEYKRYIDTSIFDGVTLGKTANNALYNNLDILDYRGMQPTYRQLSNYDAFFKPAANKNSLKGFGLADTKKLIADICRNHYKECAAIAKHLKAETKLQSAFNLWHWLHHNIRYEYDREGREEVRTPARVWADRHRGVDCDCLSVFTWCVLKCMGYNPAFELAAFRNKPAYSHIYINLDGIVVDRVWYVFNSRPPFITKTELFKVGILDNLGQLF
jgi:ribosomal protein S9